MKVLLLTLVCIVSLNCFAVERNDTILDNESIVTNSFWDNWYGQVGGDMTLLFPSGHAVKNVFPNGKSLGVSVAAGKWFSPEIGGRFRINWNNGIIKDNHNIWYYPYGVKGGSYREGGFMTFVGDIQFNLFNLFDEYEPNRKWNLVFAPRAGGWLNIGNGKGCPVLGVGITNTYRISDRWRLYADLGYTFVASINDIQSGTDHGGNSYLDINIGVEMDLSSVNRFYNSSSTDNHHSGNVVINSFWANWFLQAGLGMSLINPYNTNFANVIPNGKTFGINIGVGKWFTPEVGVRGGLNWQNGIFMNHHASYLLPREEIPATPTSKGKEASIGDPDKLYFVSIYADMFFNLHSIIAGYDESRKWNAIIFPRMGIAQNFAAEYKECPILGIGTEHTYKLNDRWKIFADFAYQVTTAGFLDGKFRHDTGLSHNGWFDINIGVQYELGMTKGWRKP